MSVGNGIWDGIVVTVLGVTTWAAGEAGRIWISGEAVSYYAPTFKTEAAYTA